MIFLSGVKISQKDDDTDPASCGMLSGGSNERHEVYENMKFVKT
jgi:hypothetical protein